MVRLQRSPRTTLLSMGPSQGEQGGSEAGPRQRRKAQPQRGEGGHGWTERPWPPAEQGASRTGVSGPPLEQHAEESWRRAAVLEDLLLEHQPLAVAAVLLKALQMKYRHAVVGMASGCRRPGRASSMGAGPCSEGQENAGKTRMRQNPDSSNQEPVRKQ